MPYLKQNFPGLLSKDAFNDLSICIAGYYEEVQGHYCKRQNVTEFQVAYCTNGKGVIRCNGKQVAISRGDIFINIPGHPHEYWADEKEPWTHYWVHFVGTSAQRYFDYMRCRPDEPGFSIGYHEHLVDLFKQMLIILQNDDPPHQIQALSGLHAILSTIVLLRRQNELLRKPARSGVQLNMDAIDRYIREQGIGITLPKLAASASLSVPHFIRLLKQKTGYSPMQYVARKKITAACQALAGQPAQSIKEIALQVGVEDQHYFSRLFRKVTGMTPLQYRQMALR